MSNMWAFVLLRLRTNRQRVLGADLSLLRPRDKSPQTWILVSSSIGERLNRQRVLDVDLSLLRIRDKSPQNYTLVSFSLGERLNRQRVLGVDLSLLRIRDKIPRACEARILALLVTACHNVEYVGFYPFHDKKLNDNAY